MSTPLIAAARDLTGRTLRHPLLIAAAIATLLVAIGAATSGFEDFIGLQGEGPLEHVSHAALLAAVIAWGVALARLPRPGQQLLAALSMAYAALLLMEEIDYGEVYGVDLGYVWLKARTGVTGLHHNPGAPVTVLGDRLLLFAVPGILWALAGVSGALRGLAPAAPRPEDGAVFLIILGIYLLSDLVLPGLHDVHQVLAYGVLLTVGVKAARGAQR